MSKPFDGAITQFLKDNTTKDQLKVFKSAKKKDIISRTFPYKTRMKREDYEAEMARLQVELVKMQTWLKSTDERICLIFEGRDAAGKGGTIKRFTEHLSPRVANVVALPAPSDVETTQWYFQRYIAHLPSGGQMLLFDRSWYNRGVVEKVFGFCTDEERETFFRQVLPLEQALVHDGMRLFKFWLNVGRAEQIRRFMERENDPLKQWKLSPVDVDGLAKWDAYSAAIEETLTRTHSEFAPWTIVRSDDKKRARLAAIRHVLHALPYDRKDEEAIGAIDPQICGGPDIWNA
ncbi:MAG: polyphosphate kinase 2 [Rhodobacteraceae bacterium]|nr:polyphosphate kinase 2 [Paracoccaceae bacterium]